MKCLKALKFTAKCGKNFHQLVQSSICLPSLELKSELLHWNPSLSIPQNRYRWLGFGEVARRISRLAKKPIFRKAYQRTRAFMWNRRRNIPRHRLIYYFCRAIRQARWQICISYQLKWLFTAFREATTIVWGVNKFSAEFYFGNARLDVNSREWHSQSFCLRQLHAPMASLISAVCDHRQFHRHLRKKTLSRSLFIFCLSFNSRRFGNDRKYSPLFA